MSDITSKLAELDRLHEAATQTGDDRDFNAAIDNAYPDLANALRTLTRERDEARAGEAAMREAWARLGQAWWVWSSRNEGPFYYEVREMAKALDAECKVFSTASPSPGAPLLAELERAKAEVAHLRVLLSNLAASETRISVGGVGGQTVDACIAREVWATRYSGTTRHDIHEALAAKEKP